MRADLQEALTNGQITKKDFYTAYYARLTLPLLNQHWKRTAQEGAQQDSTNPGAQVVATREALARQRQASQGTVAADTLQGRDRAMAVAAEERKKRKLEAEDQKKKVGLAGGGPLRGHSMLVMVVHVGCLQQPSTCLASLRVHGLCVARLSTCAWALRRSPPEQSPKRVKQQPTPPHARCPYRRCKDCSEHVPVIPSSFHPAPCLPPLPPAPLSQGAELVASVVESLRDEKQARVEEQAATAAANAHLESLAKSVEEGTRQMGLLATQLSLLVANMAGGQAGAAAQQQQ